ncbi:MAG: nicotinate-nucleotide adenylyltransferase [Nitrospirota bacterium]
MKVGIFGGTFNPIHYGHLRAAEEVRERLGFSKIIFIPSGNPPIKTRELADAKERYNMTELATAGNPFFEVSDIEFKRHGKSYTVQTMKELCDIYPDISLYFILGVDAFLDIPNWWQPERLIAIMDFIVISRASFRFIDLLSSPYIHADRGALERLDEGELESYSAKLRSNRDILAMRVPLLDISSTEIRRLTAAGKSIKYLLPEVVESFIIEKGFYKIES